MFQTSFFARLFTCCCYGCFLVNISALPSARYRQQVVWKAYAVDPNSNEGAEGVVKNSEVLNGVFTRRDLFTTLSKSLVVGCGLSSGSFSFVGKSSAFDFTSGALAVAPIDFGTPNFATLAKKIRNVCIVMDELQRDLQQERWDLVETYPGQLRSYIPIFTTYTDEMFATDDVPSNKGLRVALRYEVGRFFGALERLKQATSRRDLDEAYIAYSNMAIHFDRYLKAGNLYTYVDPLVSTEPFFEKVNDSALVYSDPKTDPPEVRDLVVLCKGPDKGKTGIVIGIFPETRNFVVKMDKFNRSSPIREIKVGKLLIK